MATAHLTCNAAHQQASRAQLGEQLKRMGNPQVLAMLASKDPVYRDLAAAEARRRGLRTAGLSR